MVEVPADSMRSGRAIEDSSREWQKARPGLLMGDPGGRVVQREYVPLESVPGYAPNVSRLAFA